MSTFEEDYAATKAYYEELRALKDKCCICAKNSYCLKCKTCTRAVCGRVTGNFISPVHDRCLCQRLQAFFWCLMQFGLDKDSACAIGSSFTEGEVWRQE